MKFYRERVVRSIGVNRVGGQLAFGFMDKPGVTIDEENSSFLYYSVVFVLNGRGTYIDQEGIEYPIKKGDLFQRFPGVTHSTYIDPDSNWKECYIDFGAEIYQFLNSMRIIRDRQPVISGANILNLESRVIELLTELKQCNESELPLVLTKTISLYQEITTISDNERDRSNWVIDRACKDFTRDFTQRIDLREYCDRYGLGYESFRKKFKSRIGLSPVQYIIRRRVDTACQILRSTDHTIGEIANDLGYKNQYEFSSQFKKITGISPNRYKNLNEIK